MIGWFQKRLFLHKWGAVGRKWPVDRFLPTTDLDLSESEKAELTLGIYGWRQLVAWYLSRFRSCDGGKQVYCFGVAHGSTVHGLVTGLRNRNMQVPFLHLFDSFQGLPKEEPGVAIPPVWQLGAFSAPREKLEGALKGLALPDDSYRLHEGWFKDTLKAELVKDGSFKPAAYVDVDADLYNSTMDILDFMFAHKLIGAGTLIGYDDWGDTDLWTAGESRAHKEIAAKYGVQFAQLFSWGEQPSIRKLFLVVAVGDR
ncbi:MAG: TylF/MycF/NovP-related O-methyltransferase [Paracoccaceae bacterium]